jgi:hypothetical protein
MRNKKNVIRIAKVTVTLITFAFMFSSCDNKPSSNKGEKSNHKEEATIDGVYKGSKNISGLEIVANLTISGNRWSASTKMGYESPEFQNGIVKGKDLFDDSGMIKIGSVSGTSANINGYPSMRKE